MKIGEIWIIKTGKRLEPYDRRGDVIEITNLYRDEEDNSDCVEYEVVYAENHVESPYEPIGGMMYREELIRDYRRENAE